MPVRRTSGEETGTGYGLRIQARRNGPDLPFLINSSRQCIELWLVSPTFGGPAAVESDFQFRLGVCRPTALGKEAMGIQFVDDYVKLSLGKAHDINGFAFRSGRCWFIKPSFTKSRSSRLPLVDLLLNLPRPTETLAVATTFDRPAVESDLRPILSPVRMWEFNSQFCL